MNIINNELMKKNNDIINNIIIENKKNLNKTKFINIGFNYFEIRNISFEIPRKNIILGTNLNTFKENKFLIKIINEMIEHKLINNSHFKNIYNILNNEINKFIKINTITKQVGRFKVLDMIQI